MRPLGVVTLPFIALPFIALTWAAPAAACIHVGRSDGPPVSINQKGQQGLLVYHEGREDLVLKIEYEAGGDVSSLGMVVPVPSLPSDYGVAAGTLFEELARWVGLRRRPPRSTSMGLRSRNGDPPPAAEALVALEPVSVGPYRIQPLRASGAPGVEALQQWMDDNVFAPIPAEMLSYYAEREWTFLAVRADPAAGGELAREGGLPPLRMTFEYDRAVYPLKLEAQGVFPVRLYVVTAEELPNSAFAGARQRGFIVAGQPHSSAQMVVNVRGFAAASAPAPLAALLSEIGGRMSEGNLSLRVLYQARFGSGRAEPSRWTEDLAIPPPEGDERLMGVAVPDDAPEEATTDEPEEEPPERDEEPPAAEETTETPATEATEGGCGACTIGAPTRRPRTWPLVGLVPVAVLLWRRRRRVH